MPARPNPLSIADARRCIWEKSDIETVLATSEIDPSILGPETPAVRVRRAERSVLGRDRRRRHRRSSIPAPPLILLSLPTLDALLLLPQVWLFRRLPPPNRSKACSKGPARGDHREASGVGSPGVRIPAGVDRAVRTRAAAAELVDVLPDTPDVASSARRCTHRGRVCRTRPRGDSEDSTLTWYSQALSAIGSVSV